MRKATRAAEKHYDVMTIDDIKSLPVNDIAEDDAKGRSQWTSFGNIPYP